MIKWYWFVILISHNLITDVNTQLMASSKKKTDPKPIFSNNYIPASMHVMFHLTDMMKYELKPDATGAGGSGVSSTTTIRPTPPHKPGNYGPASPLGPNVYFSRELDLANSYGWEPWYRFVSDKAPVSSNNKHQKRPLLMSDLPEDIDLFGAGPSDLLHLVNTLDDVDSIGDADDLDDRIDKFSVNYDDISLDYLRKKKIPPTRAYVTLLSLYDLLNKEAKELGLNKYNGYSETVLQELIKTSAGSAADQLKFVLSKVVEKKNTRKDNVLIKIKTLLTDLDKSDSYINEAIRYIPPLQFAA